MPGCTVGSRQAEHESQGESMEEDDMVMRVGNSLSTERERDEPMRREGGLQARGAYKEVPKASRRLALAAPESSRACTRVRDKISLTLIQIKLYS